MLQRIAPFALLNLGFLIMLGSLVYFSGNALPYPDPTPELLAYQTEMAQKLARLFVLGLIVATAGGVWRWRQARATGHAKN